MLVARLLIQSSAVAQGKAYPISIGPAPPAVNDARVATVLDLKQHLPPTSKIGEGRCCPLSEEGLQFPIGIAGPF